MESANITWEGGGRASGFALRDSGCGKALAGKAHCDSRSLACFGISVHGQVSVVEPVTAVDIAGPVAEFEDATALTVTVPAAPAIHWASPAWLIVAMFAALAPIKLQVPVYGGWKVTWAGEGALLKVPVAVNWTCPLGKF